MTTTNPDWKILELRGGAELGVSATELAERGARLASALDARGARAGDRICYLMDNGIPVFEVATACALLGAYPVPVNYHFTAEETRYILENSGARALVATGDFGAVAAAASAGNAALEGRRLLARGRAEAFEGFESYDAALAAAGPWTEAPRPAPGTVIYTSGTTGNPKGVMRGTEYNAARARLAAMMAEIFGLGAEPVHLVTGPLYHSAPNAFAGTTLALGGRLVVMPRYDSEALLAAVERYRVTNMHLVPTMMHRLLALPEEVRRRHDLGSLRTVQHGAAPCPPATKRAMIEWWGPVIEEYYGSTEAGFCTYIRAEEWLARPGSVGRPVEGVSVRILAEDGGDCAPGEVGEVYMKSLWTGTFEYHGDSDKKRGASREGYFTNGDMGWLDEEGYLFLCDRRGDMIIAGGVNIYPAEIEAVLHAHPDVADCAVFGIPDPEWGERVHAVVQTESGRAIDTEALRAHCTEHLARYKVPRSFEHATELPRQPNGKIYKRKLRAPHWQTHDRAI